MRVEWKTNLLIHFLINSRLAAKRFLLLIAGAGLFAKRKNHKELRFASLKSIKELSAEKKKNNHSKTLVRTVVDKQTPKCEIAVPAFHTTMKSIARTKRS